MRTVFSDNATNFVGADAELKRSIQELSEKDIQSYATSQSIEWHFNSLSASHMGGVWERLIRTTRRIMASVLPRTCRLIDEKLETVLCEIEAH